MPFLRFFRDKRGYEYFSLVHQTQGRRGTTARLLYWYRTPPNVRVGRAPFDDTVRRTLETQNPDIVFDWRRIVETPIPSADAEMWRERRRLEKAQKAARRAAALEDAAEEAAEEAAAPADAPQEDAANSGEGVATAPVPDAAATTPAASRRRRRRRRERRPGSGPGSGPGPGESGPGPMAE